MPNRSYNASSNNKLNNDYKKTYSKKNFRVLRIKNRNSKIKIPIVTHNYIPKKQWKIILNVPI